MKYNLSDYDFILFQKRKRVIIKKSKEQYINALKNKETIRARTLFNIENKKYQVLSANHKEGHKCIEFIQTRD